MTNTSIVTFIFFILLSILTVCFFWLREESEEQSALVSIAENGLTALEKKHIGTGRYETEKLNFSEKVRLNNTTGTTKNKTFPESVQFNSVNEKKEDLETFSQSVVEELYANDQDHFSEIEELLKQLSLPQDRSAIEKAIASLFISGTPDALHLALAYINSLDETTRSDFLPFLQLLENNESFESLISIVLDSNEPQFTEILIDAAGRLYDENSVEILWDMYQSSRSDEEKDKLGLLIQEARNQEAYDVLRDIVKNENDESVRLAASYALSQLDYSEEFMDNPSFQEEMLTQLIVEANDDIAANLISCMVNAATSDTIRYVMSNGQGSLAKPAVESRIAEFLMAVDEPEIVPSLRDILLHNPNQLYRESAAYSLSVIDNEPSSKALIESLDGEYPEDNNYVQQLINEMTNSIVESYRGGAYVETQRR